MLNSPLDQKQRPLTATGLWEVSIVDLEKECSAYVDTYPTRKAAEDAAAIDLNGVDPMFQRDATTYDMYGNENALICVERQYR